MWWYYEKRFENDEYIDYAYSRESHDNKKTYGTLAESRGRFWYTQSTSKLYRRVWSACAYSITIRGQWTTWGA